MVAASIILARALAPVETAIAHWRSLAVARQSYARLTALFAAIPEAAARIRRGARSASRARSLERRETCRSRLRVLPTPVVRNINFRLAPATGSASSGRARPASRRSRARLVGVWQAQNGGSVRIDGVALARLRPRRSGATSATCRKDVELFEGTIADNIARFERDASEEAIVAAARAAGVDAMIEGLPPAMRTEIGERRRCCRPASASASRSRARSMASRSWWCSTSPTPTSTPRESAPWRSAIASVRRRGGIVVVMAHRRAALAGVDQVLALAGGRVAAFGPREAVLASVLSEPAGCGRGAEGIRA